MRRVLIHWAEEQMQIYADFVNKIVFSDESHFLLDGHVNKRNCELSHYTAVESFDLTFSRAMHADNQFRATAIATGR